MKKWNLLTGTLMAGVLSSAVLAAPPRERALLAYLNIKEGTEKEFLSATKEVIQKSRKEPGNLIYILQRGSENPQQWVFYELFKSEEDLQAHRKSEHVVKFLEKVKPILVEDGFKLVEYEPCQLGLKKLKTD